MSVLSSPHFHDEAKAFQFLESIVWVDGVSCPHCGVIGGKVYEHRYLAEFEFRYNTRTANGFDDRQRAAEGLKGIVGKRLTYRPAD